MTAAIFYTATVGGIFAAAALVAHFLDFFVLWHKGANL